MTYDFYYTKRNNEHIYYSILSVEGRIEVSLYIGNKLVKRGSFLNGMHLIQHDDIILKLEIKSLKVLEELTIANEKIETQKLNHKDLMTILTDLNIYNEINPKAKPPIVYNIKSIIISLILIIIGITLQILTKGKGKIWSLMVMVILIFAYYPLFSPLLDKVPDKLMDENTRNNFKFLVAIGFMILTMVIFGG